MTRLLLINKLFHPVYGGVETTVAQIAAGLAKDKDFEVTVLAGNERPALVNKFYHWNGAAIIKTAGFGTIYNTAFSFKYPFTLRDLISKNDVFHFHTPNPLGELSFFFNKIPAHKKVIVTVHADIGQTRRKFYRPAYNFFLKKLLDRADMITTMSPQNKSGFAVLQPYLHKCQIVPLAYDASHIQPVSEMDKDNFCIAHRIDRTKKIALFAGRLSSYKGLHYLLQAIKEIDNLQLVIAGDGELNNSLRSDARTLPVIFTGFISGHEMACAYSIADVFVLPSTTETFGIVQAEAMRFGLPVVNTALQTGVNYVSIHNETGITVPPANSEALVSAISSIIHNEGLRRTFSENARRRSELFAPNAMLARFKELYLSP